MVKPAPRPDDQLLAWAGNIIRREQEGGMYGQVIITLEAGKITRAQTVKSEKPPLTEPPT